MADKNINRKPEGALSTIQGISEKPVFRQVALMIGIAASVALGAAVFMWAQSPSYSVLYSDVAESQLEEISNALKQRNIDFQIDALNRKVLVSSVDLNKARISLSALGLNQTTPKGFDILNQEQGFGTSQFIQNARYHKAMEEELARSIVSMQSVKNARVHLAIPKQSVFVRERKKPSASVILELYAGRSLAQEQVAAITNMVASSIQDMDMNNVTIVDQMGRLLTESESNTMGLNDKQMEYTHKLENLYNQRVKNILTPFLGPNGFSVQVKASLDFNRKEVTSEQFNPDLSAVRSKQLLIERSSGVNDAGVPGSLSNQPPGGSVLPEQTAAGEEGGSAKDEKGPFRSRESSTQNFEVDKSISHTSYSTGTVENISVAVVVDDSRTVDEKGVVSSKERSEKEIQRITALVKEAVGYNIQRGDTVNVVNAAFVAPPVMEALPEIPMWEQDWFWSIVKQSLAGLVILYLLFGVVRPAFKNLSKPVKDLVAIDGEEGALGLAGAGAGAGGAAGEGGADALNAPKAKAKVALDADGNELPAPDDIYQVELDMARKLVLDDPKVAAQVIKNWIHE